MLFINIKSFVYKKYSAGLYARRHTLYYEISQCQKTLLIFRLDQTVSVIFSFIYNIYLIGIGIGEYKKVMP